MNTQTGVAAYRFTVDEFDKLGEAGIFDEDDRVELLDGEIIVMSPIGSQHAGTVMRMLSAFQDQLGKRAVLDPQNPTVLDEFSEAQPDLMVLRPREDFYTTRHPVSNDILLLVEVSDTTLAYDSGPKLQKYAQCEISEVWIVNVTARQIEQFRAPVGKQYSFSEKKERGDDISIAAFPGVFFRVKDLIG
ncbi:MAG: Uma2 family endonuclease [Chthoniobacterales bacterium]